MPLGHGFFHATDVTPQGDSGLLPCESVSVRAYLSPLTTGGAISNQDPDQGDSVTAETQASWVAAWGLLSRLWTRCCFLGFSVAFSHSTRLNQGWMQCSFFWYPGTLLMSLDMKYEKKKKEKTSNSPLPKQAKASILCCAGSLLKCNLPNEILINDDSTMQGNKSSHHCFKIL